MAFLYEWDSWDQDTEFSGTLAGFTHILAMTLPAQPMVAHRGKTLARSISHLIQS